MPAARLDLGVPIDPSTVKVQRILGSGSFGEVWEVCCSLVVHSGAQWELWWLHYMGTQGRAAVGAGQPDQRVVLKRVKRNVKVC